MENEIVRPTSSIKLDTTAKGLIVPTIHVYLGAADIDLEIMRKQAVEQLKKAVIELKQNNFNTAIEGEFSL